MLVSPWTQQNVLYLKLKSLVSTNQFSRYIELVRSNVRARLHTFVTIWIVSEHNNQSISRFGVAKVAELLKLKFSDWILIRFRGKLAGMTSLFDGPLSHTAFFSFAVCLVCFFEQTAFSVFFEQTVFCVFFEQTAYVHGDIEVLVCLHQTAYIHGAIQV